MNQDKYVFAQLVEFLNNNKFRKLVDKYDGNKYVKHFTCWNQMLAMMLKRKFQLSILYRLHQSMILQRCLQFTMS